MIITPFGFGCSLEIIKSVSLESCLTDFSNNSKNFDKLEKVLKIKIDLRDFVKQYFIKHRFRIY
jgi:hypothetical protein